MLAGKGVDGGVKRDGGLARKTDDLRSLSFKNVLGTDLVQGLNVKTGVGVS